MKVRIAVAPSFTSFDPVEYGTFIESLEGHGFDTVWLSDIPLGAATDPIVALSYAAARTRTLKLGTNIVPLGRNPMHLAKELAQLDLLSNGRLLLSFVPGIDQPGERGALGVGKANRGMLLEQIVGLVRAWWRGDAVSAEFGPYRATHTRVSGWCATEKRQVWRSSTASASQARSSLVAVGCSSIIEPAVRRSTNLVMPSSMCARRVFLEQNVRFFYQK